MSYCVALKLNQGLVFGADTRTNAGVDNVACFRKLHSWEVREERVIVMLTAGNLAVTQAVMSMLNERLTEPSAGTRNLYTVSTMFQVARLVGDALRAVRSVDGSALAASNNTFAASFIVGGQIRGDSPRLFSVYNEGNFIEATSDTPFFQIGEHKYGKPILDRVVVPEMTLEDAAKLMLLSFDSTLRSNLSVGMPLDLLLYRTDALHISLERRIGKDDPYFLGLSSGWSKALREAFTRLEPFELPDKAG